MIKYLGSKRTLIPSIVQLVRSLKGVSTVVDLFSGTSRVGRGLKSEGYRVLANDHNAYAATIARCYIQADREKVYRDAKLVIDELNRIKGKPGYLTDTFCIRSRYFQPHNGERMDAIREEIARKCLPEELEAVVLVSLMEAADRVDSTTGVQMAYLKEWAPRSYNDLELRIPDLLPKAARGKGRAYQLEALHAAPKLKGDLVYLDPPYNQHKYLGNYHIWETLVLWDKPEVYGIACKREDCRTRKSLFNSKSTIHQVMREVVEQTPAPNLLVSFNNEGFISREEMEQILRTRGHVQVVTKDYKRYVGAQIGIYNPAGKQVGKVSHLNNKEYLYLVTRERVDIDIEKLGNSYSVVPAVRN